jgi:hypothetical protein
MNKSGRLAREAARVQSAGRDGDTLVAHINPSEAQILKALGGRGTINPKTGLLEFATQSNFDPDTYRRLNPDVAAAGVDPWQHYQQFGQSEGRAANSAEEAARAEGYSGGFGSGGYVDWKNQQAVTPAPTYDTSASPQGHTPNSALNDYLRSQLPDVDPNFDGQGGFWAAVDRAGYPRHFVEGMISGFTQNFDPRTGSAIRPEASGFYNGSALQPHSTYDASGAATGTYGSTGGLLGGGGFGNSGGLLGGGSNGGFPASTIPIFSNVGGMSQQPSMQPSMPTPMPSMAAPTIGNFEAPQVTPAPKTFDDILAKYSLHSTPLQNGTGFNWMTPQTTPGSVNVMDANLSRRYL